MATVNLYVAHTVTGRAGMDRLPPEQMIGPNETMGSLLSRLAQNDPENWQDIWDLPKKSLHSNIIIVVNGRGLQASEVFREALADGDKITVRRIVTGG